MYKKKELIIIISIISLTILLGFLPIMISSNNDSEVIELEENLDNKMINIKIKGELNIDHIDLEIPYGYSYGFIISKIRPYLNQYSIISNDYKKRYFESCTIYIESYDIRTNDIEDISFVNKININTASKEELMKLYGIGDKRADTIIKERDNKKIESFSELKSLIGVSNEIIEVIKEKAIL